MNNHTTKLIDGSFTKENAKSVLLKLIGDKISYHQLKKFSNEERFNHDHEHSQQRITELSSEREQLLKWLDQFEDAEKLQINCKIEIVPVEAEVLQDS
ncbi:MAG: hypothetical protein KDC49_02720 [Saprospiraceae bacterium]|nr:hypothetical protein [Saprospiraceae bacterium]